MKRDPDWEVTSWATGNSAPRTVRDAEHRTEVAVSRVIRGMPFVWLKVGDEPGPLSLRGVIERGAIGLLGNFQKPVLDPPSPNWLGFRCPRARVVQSGLWNQNHVDEEYDPRVLDALEELVNAMPTLGSNDGS